MRARGAAARCAMGIIMLDGPEPGRGSPAGALSLGEKYQREGRDFERVVRYDDRDKGSVSPRIFYLNFQNCRNETDIFYLLTTES